MGGEAGRGEGGVEGEGGSRGCIQKASVTVARAPRDERESADKEDNRGESKVRAPVRLRRGRGRREEKGRKGEDEEGDEGDSLVFAPALHQKLNRPTSRARAA